MAGANRDPDAPDARAEGRAERRTEDEAEANPEGTDRQDGGREGAEGGPWMARGGRRPPSE